MSKGFFITGTDTGVGKTVISGAVICLLRSLGFHTGVMKPVESGCDLIGDALVPHDGTFLRQIAHAEDQMSDITPSVFQSPLAPMMAAEIENKDVDIIQIKRAFARMSDKYGTLVVEGIGGLMVPLTKDYYALDLARDFGLPLIVTARPGLGTINHTILTVDTALREGLKVAGVVINYASPAVNDLAEQTNLTLLPRILQVPIAGVFPYLEHPDEESITRASLSNLNIDFFQENL